MPKTIRWHLDVLLVMVLAGLILGISAANSSGGRPAADLGQLLRNERASVDEKIASNAALQQRVKELSVEATAEAPVDPVQQITAGTIPVEGPGVTVSLTDAENVPEGPDLNPDEYVVHQQDIEGVMNALWEGGAEAMTVQGHRITPTTKIRCVGNVIYVDGTVYSPPFKIAAIGEPTRLLTALDDDPTMQIYQQYVKARGLGYAVQTEQKLKLPAQRQSTLDL